MEYKVKRYDITEQDIISGKYSTEDIINIFYVCEDVKLNQYQLDIKIVYRYIVRVVMDGHSGFFQLSNKEIWCNTAEALKNVGFVDCAEWIEEFYNSITDKTENDEYFNNMCESFDEKFSCKYKPDTIHAKIGEYIMKNPKNIAFSGEVNTLE